MHGDEHVFLIRPQQAGQGIQRLGSLDQRQARSRVIVGSHRQAGATHTRQRLEHVHMQRGGIQFLLQGFITHLQDCDLVRIGGIDGDLRVSLLQVGVGFFELLPGGDVA